MNEGSPRNEKIDENGIGEDERRASVSEITPKEWHEKLKELIKSIPE
ncbi:MAG: hypothetical protein ABSB00_00870 [Minisyncoccia bacterium]|jgi:hypothetical protein